MAAKIIKFLGGIGNQMFEYALGRALEEKTGANVFYDISSFEKAKKYIDGDTGKYKNGLQINYYEITILPNVKAKLAGKFQTLAIKIMNLTGLSKNKAFLQKIIFTSSEKELEVYADIINALKKHL